MKAKAESRPLILVTNDDGIMAPGILALTSVMKELGDVVVVAPDKPQSGMGHAITINSTLRIHKSQAHGVSQEFSCSGTPVDCVKIAVNKILHRKPDLCVSGINHGSNYSINVIYSGTMSAAVEGALENIPSIGFSLCDHALEADFGPSLVHVRRLAAQILKEGLPPGVCLNVNIPAVPAEEIKGLKVCRQTKANWIEELDERIDPSGKPYFWLTGKFDNFEKGEEGTDVWALDNNYISVVPVQFDLTAYSALPKLKHLEG
ncbi:MAG TPA: 5'/3'-nucleotidase SurE [Bacteroidia bacterium]|jgi:5'-nucleotidase|nr:5'/3'-nucleotidase SurE [Bacteroidia bacterium]